MSGDKSDRGTVFDRLFAGGVDPWCFETSPYERDKRGRTVAALKGRRWRRCLDVGCATGVLTGELLQVCDEIVGVDISRTALSIARKRLAGCTSIDLARMNIPHEWPMGQFDLIVISEVLYFLSEEEIVRCAHHSWRSLDPGGACLLVNWTGENDLPLNGDLAVQIYSSVCPWRVKDEAREEGYRLDLLTFA